MFVFLLPSNLILYFLGKTTLLNLLLYYAAELNVDVILHNAPNNSIFLLRKDGAVDYWPEDVEGALIDPSTLYLFNPDEENAQAFLSSAFTVIATSPDEKHYSKFKKLFGMDVRYLSPWTLDEAVHANNALPPNQIGRASCRERV